MLGSLDRTESLLAGSAFPSKTLKESISHDDFEDGKGPADVIIYPATQSPFSLYIRTRGVGGWWPPPHSRMAVIA